MTLKIENRIIGQNYVPFIIAENPDMHSSDTMTLNLDKSSLLSFKEFAKAVIKL